VKPWLRMRLLNVLIVWLTIQLTLSVLLADSTLSYAILAQATSKFNSRCCSLGALD
jgi:hypothetical protein